jgi:hypothetical protein
MAKSKSDLFHKSLCRTLRVDGLLFYINSVSKHPLKEIALRLAKEHENKKGAKSPESALNAYLFCETANERYAEDLEAFKLINDLSHKQSLSIIHKECNHNSPVQIPDKWDTVSRMAMYLYCKHRDVFKRCLILQDIVNLSGWKLFQGTGVSLCKEWDETIQANFIEHITEDFKTFAKSPGLNVLVEPYITKDRFMLHIWYQGSMQTVEELEAEGMVPRHFNPTKDVAIIYGVAQLT